MAVQAAVVVQTVVLAVLTFLHLMLILVVAEAYMVAVVVCQVIHK